MTRREGGEREGERGYPFHKVEETTRERMRVVCVRERLRASVCAYAYVCLCVCMHLGAPCGRHTHAPLLIQVCAIRRTEGGERESEREGTYTQMRGTERERMRAVCV